MRRLLLTNIILTVNALLKIGVPSDARQLLALLSKGSARRNFEVLQYPPLPAVRVNGEICALMSAGVAVIVLPTVTPGDASLASRALVADTCKLHSRVTCVGVSGDVPDGCMSLAPPNEAVPYAMTSFVRHEGWRDIVLLFSTQQEFVWMTSLISEGHRVPFRTHSVRVVARTEGNLDYGPALKHIKDTLAWYNISLVDATRKHSDHHSAGIKLCNLLPCIPHVVISIPGAISTFLRSAHSLSMCTPMFHYIFIVQTPEDAKFVRGVDFAACNITLASAVDVHEWTKRSTESTVDPVIHDAVSYLENLSGHWDDTWPSASCENGWRESVHWNDVARNVTVSGLTGNIHLDPLGRRYNYSVRLYKTTASGLDTLANWNSLRGKIERTESVAVSKGGLHKETLENRTLRVTVYLEAPFVMKRAPLPGESVNSNEQYEGYCIDLLKLIAGILHFNYSIHEVADKAYGSKEASGKWNGMVGELQSGTADLAVASLTISYSRSEVVDFTVPYMHLGISILFKRPTTSEASWFMFLSPLSAEVWLTIVVSYLLTSCALWLIARISPYESSPDEEAEPNQFTMGNAFWFTVSSLMQQGCELSPRAFSTRLATAVWWFFALIMISSYTANLAAFLTTQRMVTPVENADGLAAQTKIKYGTLGRGSTMSFFNESKIDTYERMWKLMSSQPGLFVKSSKEGIARVKSSDYAYLMESSMLEYAVERDCELMQIGGLLDQKGYGIGLPKGSPYRELLSTAILRLQEKTVLTELKDRWWKDKNTVCPLAKPKGSDDDESIGGIFVMLIVGIVITTVLVLLELLVRRATKTAVNEVESSRGVWQEMRRALCPKRSRTSLLKEKIDGLIKTRHGRPEYQYSNRHLDEQIKINE